MKRFLTLLALATGAMAQTQSYPPSPSGAAGGDLSGTYPNPGVAKINGTSLAGLASGLLYNTTSTGVPSIATSTNIISLFTGCSGTQYLGADGACHAASGLSPGGAAGGDLSGTYPNPGVAKINGTSLAGLASGLLYNTTSTGVPSIATSTNIISLFTSCSGTQYLGADGACHTVGGNFNANGQQIYNVGYTATSGTVTNVANLAIIAPALSGGAAVTNLTGISIAALAATGVTNAYAIQQLGLSDINYFAGKVGVGTNSPVTTLHVTGLQSVISSANNIQLATKFSDGGVNSNMAIAFDTAATSGTTALRGFFIGKASQAFGIVRYDSAGAAGPTYDVFVSSSGLVGIGTSSPGGLLSLNSSGSVSYGQYFYNNSTLKSILGQVYNSGDWSTSSSPGDFVIRSQGNSILFTTDSGASTQMIVKNGGNVGIGTVSPTSPLQVMNIPTYSSDSAAGAGGLTTGAIFKDSSGGLHIKL